MTRGIGRSSEAPGRRLDQPPTGGPPNAIRGACRFAEAPLDRASDGSDSRGLHDRVVLQSILPA
jgi:hypothetical protein